MMRLENRLDAWVDEGLVTRQQAAAILAREEREGRGTSRVPLIAEAAGYLGAALAVIGVGVLMENVWDRMTPTGLLILSLAVTVALTGAGLVTRHRTDPTAQRLTSFLWFASTIGTAASAALFGGEIVSLEAGPGTLLAGVAITAHAAALWHARPRPLQHLAFFAGAATTVAGVLMLPETTVPAVTVGVVVAAFGAAWVAGAIAGALRPEHVGIVLGSAAVLIGGEIASFGESRGGGLLFAVAVAGALMVVAVVAERPALLGAGAIGVFIAVPQLVFHFFGDSVGAPVALLISGAALLGGTMLTLRLREQV